MQLFKKIVLLLAITTLVSEIVHAQDKNNKVAVNDTVAFKDSSVSIPLLIIPFHSKYYISEADREITTGSKIDFDQLRERFQNGIISRINEKINQLEHTLPLVTYADTARDLQRIYAAVTCRYEELPEQPKTDRKSPFANLKKKENKTILKNGQLATQEAPAIKYMNAFVLKKEVFPYLADKYGSNFYVFVNQFEIRNDLSDYVAVANRTYNRQLKVHYSVCNNNGKVVYGGIAINEFPCSVNNVDEILHTYLGPICETIASHVPELHAQRPIAKKEKETSRFEK